MKDSRFITKHIPFKPSDIFEDLQKQAELSICQEVHLSNPCSSGSKRFAERKVVTTDLHGRCTDQGYISLNILSCFG